jgi:two-component system, OmpR family, KDP operon response regulator KdpE
MRILVVEDEQGIVRHLRFGLARQGFSVDTATNGRDALDLVGRGPVDVVIMDLGLPDMDGCELIALLRARQSTIPIIVLSVRTKESTIVEALELGADDYMTKPFGMEELIARIQVVRRHYASRRHLAQEPERAVYRAGDLVVDLVRHTVTLRGETVHLSPRQYRLLEVLVEQSGKLLTRESILRSVWNGNVDLQYLRIYIRALRQKIEPEPDQPVYIKTEIGVGYRMRPPD